MEARGSRDKRAFDIRRPILNISNSTKLVDQLANVPLYDVTIPTPASEVDRRRTCSTKVHDRSDPECEFNENSEG